MINLAIVPKVHKSIEYSSAYGSQHDNKYLKKIINKVFFKKKINAKIEYLDSKISRLLKFDISKFKNFNNYDAILFIGINDKGFNTALSNKDKQLFLWSFNQIEWINHPEKLKNFNIIFEQSERFKENYNIFNNKVFYTPLGFQEDRILKDNLHTEFDISFIGTLDRSRRNTNLFHRRDIILGLLKKGLSIVNFNGRFNTKVEEQLLEPLIKFPNFKLIKKFGDINDYKAGKYNLNIPFHELGSMKNLKINWGINMKDLENGNWLIHWDLWRCIGSRSNIITFDCPETRSLGLNNDNCSFYTFDTDNINGIVDEVYNIVKANNIKKIDDKCWKLNSYLTRWEFIATKINEHINESKL